MQTSVTLDEIRKAHEQLKGVVRHTPLIESSWLSKQISGKVHLKLENMQLTGSFKPRGAYIKLASLNDEERKRGVIAMSAGNHAQGVAYHAKNLSIPATIVMPEKTPFAKVEKTRQYGAEIILHGDSLYDSEIFAISIAKEKGLTIIHPYDDPAIIAGQGTTFLEMIEDAPNLDTLVIPIGGGGLASGMAIAAKATNPAIKIIGVQAKYCQNLTKKLFPNRAIPFENDGPMTSGHTIAEGITVKAIGEITSNILTDLLDDMLVVDEGPMEEAITSIISHEHVVCEGSGAAGVAALLANQDMFQGKSVGIVICGGNIDPRTLSTLLMRGLVKQNQLTQIRLVINEATHPLKTAIRAIYEDGGDVIKIEHNRLFHDNPVKFEEVTITLQVRDDQHKSDILKTLREKKFEIATD